MSLTPLITPTTPNDVLIEIKIKHENVIRIFNNLIAKNFNIENQSSQISITEINEYNKSIDPHNPTININTLINISNLFKDHWKVEFCQEGDNFYNNTYFKFTSK